MVHLFRKTNNTTIGIVSNGHPSWVWYVGCLDEIRWLHSKDDLCARLLSDPPWYSWPGEAIKLEPVEIVLAQGISLSKASAIWKMKGLRHVFRISRLRKERSGRRMPEGWSMLQTALPHEVPGGATNTGYFCGALLLRTP